MLVRAFIIARGSMGGGLIWPGGCSPGVGGRGAMGEYMHARGRYGLAMWWTRHTDQLTGTRGM
jgi:hypothetical protein